MINSEKNKVAKSNGKHPQHIEKVTPPRLLNRRTTDPVHTPNTSGSQVGFLFIASIMFVGCILGGALIYFLSLLR